MAGFAGIERVDMGADPYAEAQRLGFEAFLGALPVREALARQLAPGVVRDDGVNPFRVTEQGADRFLAFRDLVGASSEPHPTVPVTVGYVDRAVAWALAGEPVPDLGEGEQEVAGIITVPYCVTRPIELPPLLGAGAIPAGTEYDLALNEIVRTDEEGLVIHRRAVPLYGRFPPEAIVQQAAFEVWGDEWPPAGQAPEELVASLVDTRQPLWLPGETPSSRQTRLRDIL